MISRRRLGRLLPIAGPLRPRHRATEWTQVMSLPLKARAIAYGDFCRLDRSAARIPRGKLRAERRDLVSTIGGLLLREVLSARPFGPWSRRRNRLRATYAIALRHT